MRIAAYILILYTSFSCCNLTAQEHRALFIQVNFTDSAQERKHNTFNPPLDSACVTFTNESNDTKTFFTDEKGQLIMKILDGTYNITLSKIGFDSTSYTFTIEGSSINLKAKATAAPCKSGPINGGSSLNILMRKNEHKHGVRLIPHDDDDH